MKKEEKKKVLEPKKELKEDNKKINKSKEKKEDNKKIKNSKKGNIFDSIGKYFRGVWKELGRIRWTNKKDLVKYSIATVIFVLFFGIYFYGIDWIALLVRSLAN